VRLSVQRGDDILARLEHAQTRLVELVRVRTVEGSMKNPPASRCISASDGRRVSCGLSFE